MSDDRLRVMQANLESVLAQLEDKSREVDVANKESASQRELVHALTKKIDVRHSSPRSLPLRPALCTRRWTPSAPSANPTLRSLTQAVSKRNKQLEKELTRASVARETLTESGSQTDDDARLLAATAAVAAAAGALAAAESKAASDAEAASEASRRAAAELAALREAACATEARLGGELEAAAAALATECAAAATAKSSAAEILSEEQRSRRACEDALARAERLAAPREAELAQVKTNQS